MVVDLYLGFKVTSAVIGDGGYPLGICLCLEKAFLVLERNLQVNLSQADILAYQIRNPMTPLVSVLHQ